MKLVYDPENATMSYGFYVCLACESEFYGGGHALHYKGCSETGYENCEYHFGDKQVSEVLRSCKILKNDNHQWYGISKVDLLREFPELVPTEEMTDGSS